jgi:hypothetical protein
MRVALVRLEGAYRLPIGCLPNGFDVASRWLWVACPCATRPPRVGDNELQFRQLRRRKHHQLFGFHARTTY